jgi:hypothetical protein
MWLCFIDRIHARLKVLFALLLMKLHHLDCTWAAFAHTIVSDAAEIQNAIMLFSFAEGVFILVQMRVKA